MTAAVVQEVHSRTNLPWSYNEPGRRGRCDAEGHLINYHDKRPLTYDSVTGTHFSILLVMISMKVSLTEQSGKVLFRESELHISRAIPGLA